MWIKILTLLTQDKTLRLLRFFTEWSDIMSSTRSPFSSSLASTNVICRTSIPKHFKTSLENVFSQLIPSSQRFGSCSHMASSLHDQALTCIFGRHSVHRQFLQFSSVLYVKCSSSSSLYLVPSSTYFSSFLLPML